MEAHDSQKAGNLPLRLRAWYAALVAGMVTLLVLAMLFSTPIQSYRSRAVVEQTARIEGDEPIELDLLTQNQADHLAHQAYLEPARELRLAADATEAVYCEVERPTPYTSRICLEIQTRHAEDSLRVCQQIAEEFVRKAKKSFVPGLKSLRAQRSNLEERLALTRDAKRAAEDELTALQRDHVDHLAKTLEDPVDNDDTSTDEALEADVQRVRSQLQQLLARRNDLARTKTDEHPQVREVDEQLAELQKRSTALALLQRAARPASNGASTSEIAAWRGEFRRKSHELGDAIALARRREDELLADSARLAVTPEPIPLHTVVVEEPSVVEREGGRPSGTRLALLLLLSLGSSVAVHTLFHQFVAQRKLQSVDDVATHLGLPVVALTRHSAIVPGTPRWDRMIARCVAAGEGLLLATAVLAGLLVALQSDLTRSAKADPFGAVAESVDRTLVAPLRR
jgi:hypothetical protein